MKQSDRSVGIIPKSENYYLGNCHLYGSKTNCCVLPNGAAADCSYLYMGLDIQFQNFKIELRDIESARGNWEKRKFIQS